MAQSVAEISNSLEPLREVVRSLSRAASGAQPAGSERRRVLRKLKAAGNAAVPALVRGLTSPCDSEARWAHFLLSHLDAGRVRRAIADLMTGSVSTDAARERARALLSQLDSPDASRPALSNPDAAVDTMVAQLLADSGTEQGRAEAMQLILELVPEAELPSFAVELLKHGRDAAEVLLSALALHPQIARSTSDALAGVIASFAAAPAPTALDEGLAFLEADKPAAAKRRLKRYLDTHPHDAECHSALGICYLELRDYAPAYTHLKEAARLQPREALHRWNLASVAKQSGRMGGCYLALRDYLAVADSRDDAGARQAEARAFVREYEKMLRDRYAEVTLSDVLRGEELFARAHAALSEGRSDEASAGFEAVIALMPHHYPSWGNLGAAYLAAGRRTEAARCLERALEIKPDYDVARQNLALIKRSAQ